MDAIETHLHDAKVLLDGMSSPKSPVFTPDISPYQLLLDGIKADLSTDEELADRIWESTCFSKTIIRGLVAEKYHIRDAEGDHGADGSPPDTGKATELQRGAGEDDIVVLDKEVSIAGSPAFSADAKKPNDSEIDPQPPAVGSPSSVPVQSVIPENLDSQPELVSTDMGEPSTEPVDEFIHPINPIKSSKLPTEPKLKELMTRNSFCSRSPVTTTSIESIL